MRVVDGESTSTTRAGAPSSTPPKRSVSGNDVRDWHGGPGQGERGDLIAGGIRPDAAVGPTVAGLRLRGGVAAHLHTPVEKVHDPVLGHSGSRVETAFLVTIIAERRIGDLDHQERGRRMCVPVVPGRAP